MCLACAWPSLIHEPCATYICLLCLYVRCAWLLHGLASDMNPVHGLVYAWNLNARASPPNMSSWSLGVCCLEACPASCYHSCSSLDPRESLQVLNCIGTMVKKCRSRCDPSVTVEQIMQVLDSWLGQSRDLASRCLALDEKWKCVPQPIQVATSQTLLLALLPWHLPSYSLLASWRLLCCPCTRRKVLSTTQDRALTSLQRTTAVV